MTTNELYLIESTGDRRSVWGPYETLKAAQKAGGARHVVVIGDGLANGQAIHRGALQAAIQSGRITTVDGSDKTVLT